MTYSLRRVLAARFSLTMFVALALIALWAMIAAERSLQHVAGGAALTPGALAAANGNLLLVMGGIVLLGTLATAFGAYWLARSAVVPVNEMAEQAQRISPEKGGRITAHADVAEYATLVTVLNGLLSRTEDAFSSQRRFIADVSHELRTPLTSLQGQLEVALRAVRTPRDYQLVLGNALEETQHLARMCDSLLLITRAESGALVASRSHVDLTALTKKLIDKAHKRLEEKGLSVFTEFDLAGAAPPMDHKLIERGLAELIDNAIKFTPHGGQIEIGVRAAHGGVMWWVQDSGPGIADEDLPRLFEPFYRVDPARSRDNGSGLGLTLAASISRLHGGSIRVENVAGNGARFVVFFPGVAVAA